MKQSIVCLKWFSCVQFQSGNDGGLRNEILNSRNEIINSSQVEFIAGDGKDAIEALQESLPNIDLSLDGKQVQASVIKTLDEPILNHLYKSALKAMNARSSTLGVSTVQEASGNIPGVQASGQNRVFNNLAIQVSHCDSYRNTAWNSNAFSQTLDSVLAKLNFKVIFLFLKFLETIRLKLIQVCLFSSIVAVENLVIG